ncbi:hypothetical protein GCM10023323_53220 [Streptomyces thinghirensis]|uniref:Uncharacterized protein n=1 Tax=Streptomyces thinghirensis TaxID=551547 RepID=A0ABP9TBL2_9ACTN
MADARPGARIVHIARLALPRHPPAAAPGVSRTAEAFKHSGEVILASVALGCLRARLTASCSLVSLAVQSLRSM